MSEPKPSMGRIVIYNYPGVAPAQSPAVVRVVAGDDSVDLSVFGDGGVVEVAGVSKGDGPGEWNWPPRV